MSSYLSWRKDSFLESSGIIIGCDNKQEWLLPLWWKSYSAHNHFPITMVDFGVSSSIKQWCKERFEVVSLSNSFKSLFIKSSVSLKHVAHWETVYGSDSWWEKRALWHQKPLSLLSSPYKYSLWLDLDCEVKKPLDSLFKAIMNQKKELFIAEEPPEVQKLDLEKGLLLPGETLFNTGVIGYVFGSKIIFTWAQETLKRHAEFRSDQNLLSRLVFENKWQVKRLSPSYNWRISFGNLDQAHIVHWIGESGKFFLSLKN